MSATTVDGASPASALPRRTASAEAATYRWLMGAHLRSARWALGVYVFGSVVGIVGVNHFWQIEGSVVAFGRQGLIWFPFSMAIVLLAAHLPVHVQMGRTRRVLGRATVNAALTMAACYAVAIVAVMQAERALYAWQGWPHAILDQNVFAADSSQVGLVLGEYLVASSAGLLCGHLVGIVYYRVGGWWGTLALPLTVGPILLLQVAMSTDFAFLDGDLGVGTAGGWLVRAAAALVVLGAVVVAYRLVLRGTPVRTASVL